MCHCCNWLRRGPCGSCFHDRSTTSTMPIGGHPRRTGIADSPRDRPRAAEILRRPPSGGSRARLRKDWPNLQRRSEVLADATLRCAVQPLAEAGRYGVDQSVSVPDDPHADGLGPRQFRSHKASKNEAVRNRNGIPQQTIGHESIDTVEGLRREPNEGTTGPHALNPGPQPPFDDSTPTISEQLERDWHRLNEWYNEQKSQRDTP